MTKLWETLRDYQTTNIIENGVKFTEESFNQLCEEILANDAQHKIDLKFATGRGALIGAAGVGLVWAGVAGFKKFKNRKPKVIKKKDKKVLEKDVEVLEPEVLEVSEDRPPIKRVSGKDKEALAAVLTELKETEKKQSTKKR